MNALHSQERLGQRGTISLVDFALPMDLVPNGYARAISGSHKIAESI